MSKIQIFVDEQGDPQLMVDGVKGKGCVDLTAKIEELLWGEVGDSERTFTDEYEEAPELEQDQNLNQSAG